MTACVGFGKKDGSISYALIDDELDAAFKKYFYPKILEEDCDCHNGKIKSIQKLMLPSDPQSEKIKVGANFVTYVRKDGEDVTIEFDEESKEENECLRNYYRDQIIDDFRRAGRKTQKQLSRLGLDIYELEYKLKKERAEREIRKHQHKSKQESDNADLAFKN